MISAQIINTLQTILSAGVGPFEVATFTICQISGGEAINVIPDYVEMKGMVRCIEKSSKELIRKKMKQVVEATATAMGGNAEIDFIPGFPSVNNDPNLTKIVMNAAKKMLPSPDGYIEVERPHMGSEDFAYY